jgi:hypothetical protein
MEDNKGDQGDQGTYIELSQEQSGTDVIYHGMTHIQMMSFWISLDY